MARVHTHYDNLKVARDAPPEVIRAAYKTLSQKHHPDRNGNSKEAIRIIQLINTAYEVLSDPVRRREHDEWIARAEHEAERKSESASASGFSRSKQASAATPTHAAPPASHRTRRRSSRQPWLTRVLQQGATSWERLCRKLARKVFRKV